MIRLENISVRLGDFSLKDISLEVLQGEYFVLLGPSGAGKTVLLEAVTGITPPQKGRIFLKERDISREKIQRRNIGLVYQDKTLFPHMTVEQNILFALGDSGLSGRKKRNRVHETAALVGAADILKRYPLTLSGGEYQRVSLARSIIRNPVCLLLDEPLSSLDAGAKKELRSLLRQLNREGLTMLHVTHEYEEAVTLAHRVGIVEKGRLVQTGTPEEIFHHPKNPFVAEFTGIRNFLKGQLKQSPGETTFRSGGLTFHISTRHPSGAGYLMIDSREIILSKKQQDSSALNNFCGRITDVLLNTGGIEVIVDIGMEIVTLITSRSMERMALAPGQEIWISFKAGAARFISE